LSVVIAFPSAFTNEQTLAQTIQSTLSGITDIAIEHTCIVCEASNAVELASQLERMFGIETVAIANKVSTNFSDLTAAIAQVGKKIILPGDRFYVKVIIQPAAKCDYVSRDIEFAASGTIAARLASIKAMPAKTETDASRLVLTVIGKESAYVCIQLMTAPGGLITGLHGRALSSIHDSLSCLSSMMAAKAGFDCSSVVLPYVDESELEINAKLVQLFATKSGRKKQTILAMPINVPTKKGTASVLLKEKIISEILMQCQKKRIVFPLTAAVHPIWFIESVIQDAVFTGKIPFLPLQFLSSELCKIAEEAAIELNVSAMEIAKDKLVRYSNAVDSEARLAIKRTKRLDLKIGPNYLHDIIDSI
jgi:hypothetical protein